MRLQSKLNPALFLAACRAHGLPEPMPEYQFLRRKDTLMSTNGAISRLYKMHSKARKGDREALAIAIRALRESDDALFIAVKQLAVDFQEVYQLSKREVEE